MGLAMHSIELASLPKMAGNFPVRPDASPNLATQAYSHLRSLI